MREKREFSKWEPALASALVKELEGLELTAYKCPAGIWTIGYGHTGNVREGERISTHQADAILADDLEATALRLRQAVKVLVTLGQFKALLSFAFNVGANACKDSTLLKKLNAGDESGAAAEFARWVYADGKKIQGLTKRRAREAKIFTEE